MRAFEGAAQARRVVHVGLHDLGPEGGERPGLLGRGVARQGDYPVADVVKNDLAKGWGITSIYEP